MRVLSFIVIGELTTDLSESNQKVFNFFLNFSITPHLKKDLSLARSVGAIFLNLYKSYHAIIIIIMTK